MNSKPTLKSLLEGRQGFLHLKISSDFLKLLNLSGL